MSQFRRYILIVAQISVLLIAASAACFVVVNVAATLWYPDRTGRFIGAVTKVGWGEAYISLWNSGSGNYGVGTTEDVLTNVKPVLDDHNAVVDRFVDCMRASDRRMLPRSVAGLMNVGIYGNDSYTNDPDSVDIRNKATLTTMARPEIGILELSKRIGEQRLLLAAAVQKQYRFWEYTSLLTITLGMLTTILVSFSSTEFGRGDGRTQRVIRIFAIVFPALGTGAAAAIAFYGPQSVWNQSSRTLASLTQLHGQIAMEISRRECLPATTQPKDQTDISNLLNDWSKRYSDVLTLAAATQSSGQAVSGGAATTQSSGQAGSGGASTGVGSQGGTRTKSD